MNIQEAENFKNTLLNYINNSGLQISLAYYILKDVLHDLEKAYIQAMAQESIDDSITHQTEIIELSSNN